MNIAKVFLIFLISLFSSLQVVVAEMPKPLVEIEWLANNLDKVAILDVRAEEKSFSTAPVFVKDKKSKKQHLVRVGGHIPGAKMVFYKNAK